MQPGLPMRRAESNAFENRLEEAELVVEPAIDHLLAGVPMREVAIDATSG